MARVNLIALVALLVVVPAATASRNLPESTVVDTKTPAGVDQKNFVAFGRVDVGEAIRAFGDTADDVLGDLGGGGVGSDEFAVAGGVGRLGGIGGAGGGLGGLGGEAGGIRP